jgi:glycosyltransferase involved in cell wall biosynthesis
MAVRVGFVASDNYYSRSTWSGTLFSMNQALKATDLEIVDLGNPSPPSRWRRKWKHLVDRVSRRLGRETGPGKAGSPQNVSHCQAFANQVAKQLRRQPCDVMFIAMIDAELNYLPPEIDVPIVKTSDATVPLLREHYGLKLDVQEADWVLQHEAKAIGRARRIVYPSDWAAASAVRDYQADPGKITVIPFGANMDDVPPLESVLAPRPRPPCRLLFVGRDWERKGGDLAVQVLEALVKRGIDAELTVLGSVPPAGITHPKLTVIPFLNKDVPEERQRIRELYLNAHFFLMPTRAECFGIVFCEANAFGLPVLTREVGGIPTVIKNGRNGFLFPVSAPAEAYAECIQQAFADEGRYAALVRSAREEYDQRLNWKSWAQGVRNVILDLAGARA